MTSKGVEFPRPPIWHAACCPDARAAMYALDACRPGSRVSAVTQPLPQALCL